jgi:hypothetical protein
MGRIALAQGRLRVGHDGRSSNVITAIRQAAD